MSKERYSDDHTIEVIGDTQTITLTDNASVTNDFSVGGDTTLSGGLSVVGATTGAAITGTSLVSSGTLSVASTSSLHTTTVTGDLTVSGTLARSVVDIIYTSISGSIFTYEGDWTSSFTWGISSAGSTQMPGGSASKSFRCALQGIPDGATIKTLYAYFTPDDASGFSITVTLNKRNLVSGTDSVVATASATSGTAGAFQSCFVSSINETIDYSLYIYTLRATLDDGVGTLSFAGVRLSAEVTNYS